jgi:hypothetical protein
MIDLLQKQKIKNSRPFCTRIVFCDKLQLDSVPFLNPGHPLASYLNLQ